jgi:hypothetical protein
MIKRRLRFQFFRVVRMRMFQPRGHMNVTALVAEVVPAHARSKSIELWWPDEARGGQQGSPTHIWAEQDSRLSTRRDQRYDPPLNHLVLLGLSTPDFELMQRSIQSGSGCFR